MRVAFIPPSVGEYKTLFSSGVQLRKGGGLDDIRILNSTADYHRGGGIFSTLAGIAKRAFPFLLKNIIAPSALSFGRDVLTDISQGNTDIKSTLKKRGLEAAREAGRRLVSGGGKRKNKCSIGRIGKRKRVRKCHKDDIFSVV